MSKAAQRAKASTSTNISSNKETPQMNNLNNKPTLGNTMESKLSNFESNLNQNSNKNITEVKNKNNNSIHSNKNIKGDFFKNFEISSGSSEFNEEKQKMMMHTLSKMLHLNVDGSNHNQMNLHLNTDYIEKNKKLQELKERVENYENENKALLKQYTEKENEYEGKIKILERQLLSSDKYDVVLIQKQNKDYEMQISNLNKTIQNLASKYTDENLKFKSMIGDIMMLKDQLQSELTSLASLKKEITSKKNVVKTNKKAELVLKYNNPVPLNDVNDTENPNDIKRYQVRRTTRTEFDNK